MVGQYYFEGIVCEGISGGSGKEERWLTLSDSSQASYSHKYDPCLRYTNEHYGIWEQNNDTIKFIDELLSDDDKEQIFLFKVINKNKIIDITNSKKHFILVRKK